MLRNDLSAMPWCDDDCSRSTVNPDQIVDNIQRPPPCDEEETSADVSQPALPRQPSTSTDRTNDDVDRLVSPWQPCTSTESHTSTQLPSVNNGKC